MTSQNDSALSVASLGRGSGARMQRTPSHESLTTHPLLSPPLNQIEPDSQTATRYVPYTPRHRTQHSASTPATSVSPQPTISISNSTPNPSFQATASPIGVTGRLQLQNLKAEVQAMGLGNESIGWVMLEKLCSSAPFPESERAEWDEVWDLITKGQVSYFSKILPTHSPSGSGDVTASCRAHDGKHRKSRTFARTSRTLQSSFSKCVARCHCHWRTWHP